MSYRWYYQLLNDEFGPVPEVQILELAEDGTLSDGDLVRREDSQVWVPLRQMHADNAASVPSAEPEQLGDLSELSFSFGDSSAVPHDEDRSCDLRIDDICFEDASAQPQVASRAAGSAHDDSTENDAWYCLSMGDVLGPLPRRALIRMADSGMLTETDKVRSSEAADWVPCTEIPELAASFLSINRRAEKATKAGTSGALKTPSPGRPQHTDGGRVAPNDSKPVRPRTKVPRQRATRTDGRPKKKRPVPQEDVPDALFNEVFADEQQKPSNVKAFTAPALTKVTANAEAGSSAAADSAVEASAAPASSLSSAVFSAAEAALPKTKTKTSKRPSSGKSFRMPEMPQPKTLGIAAGGLLAILLVVGFATGKVSLSSIGFSVNAKSALTEFGREYTQMSASAISDEDWKQFGDRVRPVIKKIHGDIVKKRTRTPDDTRYAQAASKLLLIVDDRPDNTESLQKNFADFQELMGGS